MNFAFLCHTQSCAFNRSRRSYVPAAAAPNLQQSMSMARIDIIVAHPDDRVTTTPCGHGVATAGDHRPIIAPPVLFPTTQLKRAAPLSTSPRCLRFACSRTKLEHARELHIARVDQGRVDLTANLGHPNEEISKDVHVGASTRIWVSCQYVWMCERAYFFRILPHAIHSYC